jgi:hypothetical protein
MDKQEVIKEKKKLLRFWQDEARSKTCDLGKVIRKADKLEKEIYKLENEREEHEN